MAIDSVANGFSLKKINIQISIHGFIANVTSELHYINDSDENIETEFVFPLDTEAAVYKFEAEIDGRTIVAEVQEKSQAKSTFRDAIDSGHMAMYMGEDDRAGDIFRLKLGNLPAKTSAKLTFAYAQEIEITADKTGTFMLPTVLNPRYAPDCGKLSIIQMDQFYYPDFVMNLEAVIIGGKKLMVSGNKMEFDVFADKMKNKEVLSTRLAGGSDFSIVLNYRGFEKPEAVLEIGKKDTENVFLSSDILMVNFSPEFKELDTNIPCEFVFIIDRSGSMMGSRIEKAKEALLLMLKSLPVNCIFNVVSFGSSYSKLFTRSLEYNEKNLQNAMDLQKNMIADMGGTEIYKPLEDIFKNKPADSYARQVFLLTDGQVWNVPEIVKLVKKQKNTRIFTFGIGDGCSTELIKEVAKASRGKATFVKDNERLASKIMSVMKSSVQCGITDVSLTWNLPEGCSVINASEEVPPVFQGDKLILYGIISRDISKRFPGKSSMKLAGKAGDKNVEYNMDFTLSATSRSSNKDESCPLHRLAAKTRLSEMEMNGADEHEIVVLSTAANVTSTQTAFVGVDKTSGDVISKCQDTEQLKEEMISHTISRKRKYGGNIKRKKAKCANFGGAVLLPKKKKAASKAKQAYRACSPATSRCRKLLKSEDSDLALDDTSKMIKLVENQRFDGSWQLNKTLSEILGLSLNKIKSASVVKDVNVWATALAIAFLRKDWKEQKAEWEMIEEKALTWLRSKDHEGKDIMQEAMAFLSA
ncbi:von Willebrand factor A domain-containing protein 5A-like [Saccostrea echinata]|uniref:von Willebrand factor A domain-containing protein 5A-like n=1 Tax=Saccostrea echinata TaxID=191078 RepID=UPI002A82C4B4|nr:von Willebrand factor A domain-containing protein 5A-like [Saccostrea echinata]